MSVRQLHVKGQTFLWNAQCLSFITSFHRSQVDGLSYPNSLPCPRCTLKFKSIREPIHTFNLKLMVLFTWLQNSLIPLSPSIKLLKKSASFCKCPETTNLKHKPLLKRTSLLLDHVHICEKLASIINVALSLFFLSDTLDFSPSPTPLKRRGIHYCSKYKHTDTIYLPSQ